MQNRKAAVGALSPPIAYGAVVGIVASCTVLNSSISPWLSLTDLAMVYLLGVVIAATYLPWHTSVTSAVLSLFCFDFFFVPPVFTFQFADKQNLLTGLILLAVGVITSALASARRGQTKAAAEAAMIAREEQLRSSLLASISHDLRTPLAVIAGSASTLFENRDRLTRQEQDELLNTLFEGARRMSVDVSNVLDMTRLSAGPVKLNLQWYPLEELIGAAIEACKSKLASHPLAVSVPDDMPLVRVDGVLFEKLLVNLLENAAKHTVPGTRVTALVERTQSGVQVSVEDDGPGLPAELKERLFEKFERGRSEGETVGSGLGLAICRAIAQLHGMDISADNRLEGGARFVVCIRHIRASGSAQDDT